MGAEATEEQVWAYLGNYVEDARADKYPELAGLIRNALAYNRDFIAPTLLRRKPEGVEVAALERDLKRVVWGKSVSGRVELGVCRNSKKTHRTGDQYN